MSTPEYPIPEPVPLPQMQEVLRANGWKFFVEDDIPGCSRSYPRINSVLEGDAWKLTALEFASIAEQQAPWLSKANVTWVKGTLTDVIIELFAAENDMQDVTQVYLMDGFLRERGFEEVDQAKLFEWLRRKVQSGQPQPGTKEFYQQQPRSAVLRAICLQVIAEYAKVGLAEGTEGRAMERLLELNRRLADLAIEPDMHNQARPIDFVDPVVLAERIAGMLRSDLLNGRGFSGNAAATLAARSWPNENDSPLVEIVSGSEVSQAASFIMDLTRLSKQLGLEPDEDI